MQRAVRRVLDDERGGGAPLGQRPGLDGLARALHAGEAPGAQQHRPLRERCEVLRAVGHAALRAAGPPAPRGVDELVAPERGAIDPGGREARGVEAVRDDLAACRVDAEQRGRALALALGEQQQPLAALGPAPHPPRPCPRMGPVRRRARGDLLEHQQLRAVEVADHRHPGRDAGRRLVQRREVVQVQHVGPGGAGLGQGTAPRGDVLLEGRRADHREAGVRRARAVLEGRVHRRVARGEVDRDDLRAGVEGTGVAVAAGQRAAHDRDVVPEHLQPPREGPDDLRRTTAGKEHHSADHPHATPSRATVDPGRRAPR